MTTLTADEIRSRVETDWNRIVKVLAEKVALQSISAKGITAEHMKRSAEFVADELRLVGVDAKVVQASNADGTPGAWEVIGSHIVSPDAPTVLLYAHHDVQPVPDPAEWNTDPFVATKDALEAMTEAFGVEPINKGEGGSIPFIPELQRIFPNAQVLVTGPEDPKANAHSPNESISLPGLKNNVITEALLLDKLGK